PEIVDQGGRVVAEEGCLSIPGIFAPVARAEWVRLEAQDEEGQPVTVETKGLSARVIQHEMDHLDGVLFIDRLDPVTRRRALQEISERVVAGEDVPVKRSPHSGLL
ncbi:MAG TPA: peptide deformylase, partial [Acidimicrobiales bacterium]|nr:peptide deformylase [Acidimicrobiales bacterium]